jgi:methenyltetrahydromethanopterin cyclohydrolase
MIGDVINTLELNRRAAVLSEQLIADSAALRLGVSTTPCGARIVDCGIQFPGGLEAGRRLAEICLAGLGQVRFVPATAEMDNGLAVLVSTDQPVAACMASQYAGWQLARDKFFAMGSGPMRAAAGKEALFDSIGYREQATEAVGILETRKLPPDELCADIAKACGVAPDKLTLLVAPTASIAGSVQVVARSVETALHKLFELGFDLQRIESGAGVAPLPPVSGDDLVAIGRTNDAILYGGEVTLWVRGDDASLDAIGPKVPSGASSDFGQPFAAIFERYGRDFYKIDPHLFSPAVVTLANLDTGRAVRFGHVLPRVVHESFDIRQIS